MAQTLFDASLDENATLIVVSHDRSFLNTVCNQIIHFNNEHQLIYYNGNYDTFEQARGKKVYKTPFTMTFLNGSTIQNEFRR